MQKFVGNEERAEWEQHSNSDGVTAFSLGSDCTESRYRLYSNAISLMVQLIHFIDELLFRQGWF